MSGYFSEAGSVEAVNARMSKDIDPRLAKVTARLMWHLHAFVKEVQLSQEEWEFGIDFLTKTGKICGVERQEFILLSDVLGLSMLVDALNNHRPPKATENTVFGPFHVRGAPIRKMDDNINLDGKGESCLYQGKVIDLEGRPIENAQIEVWSDNADGFYDVQQLGHQPKWNNRGIFITGADGSYHFLGIKPVSYAIPNDGPVGKMLEALGRHPFRPAHVHYLITADGYQKLVTHIFVAGDPYLESDAVFGVKESLIGKFEPVSNGSSQCRSSFNFVLARQSE